MRIFLLYCKIIIMGSASMKFSMAVAQHGAWPRGTATYWLLCSFSELKLNLLFFVCGPTFSQSDVNMSFFPPFQTPLSLKPNKTLLFLWLPWSDLALFYSPPRPAIKAFSLFSLSAPASLLCRGKNHHFWCHDLDQWGDWLLAATPSLSSLHQPVASLRFLGPIFFFSFHLCYCH